MFFKSSLRHFCLYVCVLFFSLNAKAIDVEAFYLASCKREVGLILDVGQRYISLLTLDGNLKKLQRHEVIYISSYPLDSVPISKFINPQSTPILTIDSYQNYKMAQIVRGWPIDFSEEKVSFLTTRGREAVVKRRTMWELTYSDLPQGLGFNNTVKTRYNLVHPYAFAYCKPDIKGPRHAKRVQKVFPQQLLSDPVMIKREFDRLQQGHEQLKKYNGDQQFYPVPELYGNHSSLGMWYMAGSRYGSSSNRNNNFTPLLIDEYSGGPFGYQHRFLSGSGPMDYSIHEETQTQVYYRFKADYFHLSLMFDPSVILIGSKYNWGINDLDSHDARVSETGLIEMGFDYGSLSFEMVMVATGNIAFRQGDLFERRSVELPRVGVRFQRPRYMASIQVGNGSLDEVFKVSFLRANFKYEWSRNWDLTASFIKRDLDYNSIGLPPYRDYDEFVHTSSSQSLSTYIFYKGRQLNYAGMVSVEKVSSKYGLTSASESDDNIYPKLGAMVSLSF